MKPKHYKTERDLTSNPNPQQVNPTLSFWYRIVTLEEANTFFLMINLESVGLLVDPNGLFIEVKSGGYQP